MLVFIEFIKKSLFLLKKMRINPKNTINAFFKFLQFYQKCQEIIFLAHYFSIIILIGQSDSTTH